MKNAKFSVTNLSRIKFSIDDIQIIHASDYFRFRSYFKLYLSILYDSVVFKIPTELLIKK